MKILYVSKTCSKKTFESIYQSSLVKPQQQDQRFHQMLMEGLSKNDVEVIALTSRPINRSNTNKLWFKKAHDKEEGILYHYLSFINIKILRQFTLFLSLIFSVLKYGLKDKKETYIVVDVLNLALSLAVVFMSRLVGIKRIAVVTDIADELDDKGRLYKKLTTSYTKKYHGYLILTESMNERINPKSKPFILMEGLTRPHSIKDMAKFERFTMLYAGGLSKTSGVDVLVKAFIHADLEDTDLIICGDGPLKDELISYSTSYPSIQYLGSLLNDEVIKLEYQSHLLINPRSSTLSQTKYAFPSKILEYLSTGVPVLSTRLEGIPKSYDRLLHFIEDESVEGIAKKLLELRHQKDLKAFGLKAKTYVDQHKTNIAQARRFMTWLNENTF